MATRYASSAGGGAHDGTTEADAWSYAEMILACDGHYTYFKGNHTLSADSTLSGCPGTVNSPTVIEGYTTTPGDGYQGRSNNGSGALVLTNFPVITLNSNCEILLASSYLVMRCFKFVGATNAFTAYINGYATAYYQCYASNTGGTGCFGAGGSSNRSYFIDCDGVQAGSAASIVFYIGTGTDNTCYGCQAWNNSSNTGACSIMMGNSHTAVKNIIYESLGIGIDITTGNNRIFDNTIYKQAIAIRTPNSVRTEINCLINNVITDSTARVTNLYAATANHPMYFFNNRSRDNGADTGITYPELSSVTTDTGGAETDFIDAANDDLRPIPSSPIVRSGPSGNHIGGLIPRKFTRSY